MCKGSNTTSTSTAPNPQAGAAYSNLLTQAGQVASTPYTPYTGELTAPVNSQQQAGIAGVNQYAQYAQPYIQQAAGLATQAAAPITGQQIQNYENPYTQQVVNSTEAQFANTNAQQQQQVLGNSVAQGALGGDRTAVAQATLAGQQQTQEAPVIAGLESQGYNTALSTALSEQQNEAQGAYSIGNLGVSGENAALSGANAQVGAGTLEQQTQQAQDTAAYQQFLQQQAYPYQQLSFEAGIDTGVGSQLGGTSETSAPPPNYMAQIAGAGLGAFAALAKRGGRIKGLATGGTAAYPLFGGGYGMPTTPYTGGPSWIPGMGITHGQGAPRPPQAPNANAGVQSPQQMVQQASKIAGGVNLSGASYGGGNALTDAYGGSSSSPLDGLDASDYGVGFRRGGGIPVRAGLGLPSFLRRVRGGFADGGAPYDQDYFDATFGTSPQVLVPPAGLSAPQRDIVSNPSSMQAYHATAAQDAALEYPNIGAGAAYGQQNPYAPPQAPRGVSTDDSDSLPPQIIGSPTTQASSPAMAYGSQQAPTAGLAAPVEEAAPSEAAPQGQPASGGLFSGHGLLGLSPDVKMSLLSAGLGMMASRSPFLGTAIGEGGLEGLATYGSLQQQHVEQEEKQQDIQLKVRQLDQAAKAEQDKVAAETRPYSEMTAAQKADLEFKQRAEARQEMQPVKIGTDMSTGTDIYAVRDPQAPGGFRRIDPNAIGGAPGTPNGTGVPVPGPSAPSSQEQLPASASPTAGDTPDNVKPEVLGSLDPQLASQVKALDEGRMQFPTGFALKSPYWQNMLRLVSNYDPSFDAINYNARARTRNDFTAGKSAQNITSFNTAIGHLDTLDKSIDGLNNSNYPWWNKIANATAVSAGNTGFQSAEKNFIAAKQAVTDELTRAFRGSGGNVHDIVGWENTLSEADSPSALHTAVKQAVDLLHSRIEAVGDQYNRGMGTTRDPLTLLSPHAQATVNRLSGVGQAAPQAAAIDPRDAAALKANASNPAAAAAIDKKYGQGTAARLLGAQ